MSNKLTFSGHDSFECRQFWLKKGYDHIKAGLKFNDEAVVQLGVGRNMVSSIKHWMRAYGLVDANEQLTEFAHEIFSAKGFDPFLEDEATLWLLHYKIVTTNYASLYSILFNDFRKLKPEFTKEHLIQFIKAKEKEVNPNTLGKDFETITKTYIPKDGEVEENYDGLLTDLHLIRETKREKNSVYIIESSERNSIPPSIIFYCILDQLPNVRSINFDSLLNDSNSVGLVFALNKDNLTEKLKAIAESYKTTGVVYSEYAGVRELQFKKVIPNKHIILKQYYNLVHVA